MNNTAGNHELIICKTETMNISLIPFHVYKQLKWYELAIVEIYCKMLWKILCYDQLFSFCCEKICDMFCLICSMFLPVLLFCDVLHCLLSASQVRKSTGAIIDEDKFSQCPAYVVWVFQKLKVMMITYIWRVKNASLCL